MRAPDPSWEMTYQHGRRAHRHRCKCCNRIVNAGEVVRMARVTFSSGTAVVHKACADAPFNQVVGEPRSPWTYKDALDCWGTEYLRSCGFRNLPEHLMATYKRPLHPAAGFFALLNYFAMIVA